MRERRRSRAAQTKSPLQRAGFAFSNPFTVFPRIKAATTDAEKKTAATVLAGTAVAKMVLVYFRRRSFSKAPAPNAANASVEGSGAGAMAV